MQSTRVSKIVIRRGEVRDLPELTEIYNHYVRETAVTFDLEPFDPVSREMWFARFSSRGRYQVFVGEGDDGLLGYACSHTFRAKAAYDRTVETTVYLDPCATGKRLGTQLYARLFESLRETDVHLSAAGIALPNEASVALHRRFGFERVGVFREVGHKFGRAWDVEWWQKRLAAEPGAI